MTPDELRAVMAYLRERVDIDSDSAEAPGRITFHAPTEHEMVDAGLNAEGVRLILGAPWWEEMATDIIETPEFCDPDDSPTQVLEYARDVVSDYLRKRVRLDQA
jgi:hypothetical protein